MLGAAKSSGPITTLESKQIYHYCFLTVVCNIIMLRQTATKAIHVLFVLGNVLNLLSLRIFLSFFFVISKTCSLNGTAFPTATWISPLTHMVSQIHPKDCKKY